MQTHIRRKDTFFRMGARYLILHVQWEITGNWSDRNYGNHVTKEKITADGQPAAGRTVPEFGVTSKDGTVQVQLRIDWKVRNSVAADPKVALLEVRDHVAGWVD